jgi:ferredoxin
MCEQVYRKLARRLNEIPNGYPATDSGAELRLLAKIFAPEEAELAAVMRLMPEPGAAIAERAGIDPRRARRILKDMARKGLIRAARGEGELGFALIPFVVGFYEAQLPRMDAELATLFEEYYRETGGGMAGDAPPLHRVIPVGEAICHELEVSPHEQAAQMIERAKSWAVAECICRVQQHLVGKGCDRPMENCLSFSSIEGAFDYSKTVRPIGKEEALDILREAAQAGLVHTVGNYRNGNWYICNCCTCCCGVLRRVAEMGVPTAVARSSFRAVVDQGLCLGCGSCADRCQFGALSVPQQVCTVELARCVGCGACVTACPVGALHLERRPEGEVSLPPVDFDEWMERRAQERGISMADIS